jgi:Tol biopolymer transport system component
VPDSPIGFRPCFTYAGASADAAHVFFAAPISYAGVPQGKGFSLYEWFEGKLRPVSVLPGKSEAATPTARTSFGAGNANCQWGLSNLRHVVSADGSRAFWTYLPEPEGSEPSKLLVRIDGAETIQLDAKAAGGAGSGNGNLLAASADGSVAYFTDSERLISGAKAEAGKPDLYRYELGAAKPLTDLTKGTVPGDVKGLVGASDDGSYVYFVAGAVLSGEEENGAGAKAVGGKNNLYLFHEGKTTFIATLSSDSQAADALDWETQPKNLSAHVSPDGRHLAFLSNEAQALAGYDNTIASGEHCRYNVTTKELEGSPLCPQAFLYDADSSDLICASCNPSGSRPLGRTVLPGWSNPYEGPRYISDDGSRLFFESFDALSAADENGKSDIYEFEVEGTGSCTAENPAFDPTSGGCHFLISSGKSEDESYLVDASSDGRDVFFSTRSPLIGWDVNPNFDVYDARVGGGFPEPSVQPICQGEGCKAPPTAPPVISSPPRFEGPGNKVQKPNKPRKPKKHRHAHKHKAKAHKHKAKKKQAKAGHKRRTAR